MMNVIGESLAPVRKQVESHITRRRREVIPSVFRRKSHPSEIRPVGKPSYHRR